MQGWCHGSWRFRAITYLEDQGPLSSVSPGPCIGRREVVRRSPRVSLPSRLCSPFCSTSLGPGPRASLSRRWYARSRCHGQGQRVRAGEPVGALSRDAQAPPFNVQVVRADESEGDTARASPDAAPSGGPAGPSYKKQGVAIQLTVSRWLLLRGSEALKA